MDTLSILLISLVVLLLFGVPVYMVLISSTMISLFVFSSLPLTVIHNALFEGLNSFPLLAIPCFVVAGTLMEQGGVTGQIIDVVKMLVGRMYGGLGITTIMACTFFAAISGSGPGTVAAVGTLLIPSMLRQGYSPQYAASVSSSGGTVGILIPPSNPLIIYAVPPAAAMPCRKKTIWCAGTTSCACASWTGGTGTLLPAPPGCWPGDAALPCRIAWRERSV